MSEWWTYRLSDLLLFSPRAWTRMLELYNLTAWPAHLVALALGGLALWMLWRGRPSAGRVATVVLAAAWVWVAWTFHLAHYASINWAARWFAAAFALQAVLLLWAGVFRDRLRPAGSARDGRGWVALAGFALLGWPLLAPLGGQGWTAAQVFGMAPDPTAVATLGVLLLATPRLQALLMPLPLLWCLVSGLTLWMLRSPEAVMPLLMGALALSLALGRGRKGTGHGKTTHPAVGP